MNILAIKFLYIYFMENLFESLKNYFENTSKEVIDNDWDEIKCLNEIGPDVIEYAEYVRTHFGVEVSYSNSERVLNMHKFDVSISYNYCRIAANAKYCFAA